MATTPNYDINYDDKRFTQVSTEKKEALTANEKTYDNMINASDAFYKAQSDAAQNYADRQAQIQQQQTDFAIEQINQQKQQTTKDYLKEQSGAYVDWQKQSNQYGANAEQMAAQGMQNTGYSESSQVSMYNTYQNRVATARESYQRAILNYDNAIKDARLQNNAALAEIAYNALQKQLELSLAGFQYKNELVIQKADKALQIDEMYNNRWQDVLNQMNTENQLKETVRSNQAQEAYQQQQIEISKAQLAEEKRQFDETMAYNKSKSKGGSGGSGGNGGNVRNDGGNGGNVKNTVKPSDVRGFNSGNDSKVSNRHGDSWVEIPGHGRFSWTEVYAYVKSGQIKETVTKDGTKYTWVSKNKSKNGYSATSGKLNVTPDAKGYAAKQEELWKGNWGLR